MIFSNKNGLYLSLVPIQCHLGYWKIPFINFNLEDIIVVILPSKISIIMYAFNSCYSVNYLELIVSLYFFHTLNLLNTQQENKNDQFSALNALFVVYLN